MSCCTSAPIVTQTCETLLSKCEVPIIDLAHMEIQRVTLLRLLGNEARQLARQTSKPTPTATASPFTGRGAYLRPDDPLSDKCNLQKKNYDRVNREKREKKKKEIVTVIARRLTRIELPKNPLAANAGDTAMNSFEFCW
ncbi:hypothetical protein WN48_05692 [Eufriesea mexicana]|nr:hypothetical protein WN48_05692 [Eufriesea mexicana]